MIPLSEPFEDFFEFRLKVVGEQFLRVVMMNANRQEIYSSKAIPDRMIHEAAFLFNKTIISSRNGADAGEFRTEDADRVWKRLAGKDLADHDESNDQYTYTGYRIRNRFDPGYENFELKDMGSLQRYINMPVVEMMTVKPVWDADHEHEKYDRLEVPFELLVAKVDFGNSALTACSITFPVMNGLAVF